MIYNLFNVNLVIFFSFFAIFRSFESQKPWTECIKNRIYTIFTTDSPTMRYFLVWG